MAVQFDQLPDINGNKQAPEDTADTIEGGGDVKAMGGGGGLEAASALLAIDSERAAKAPELFKAEGQARAQYNTAIGGLLSSVDNTKATVDDANNKLLGASSVPAGLGKILSWFGVNDYDTTYQKQRIDSATRSLAMDSQRVQFLGTAADAATQQANEGRQSAQNLLNTYLSLKADKRADASLGLQADANARAAAEHKIGMQLRGMQLQNAKVDQMSTGDLETAVKTPGLFPDMPMGYLQQELNKRKSSDTALQQAGLILEGTKLGNEQAKLKHAQDLINFSLLNMSSPMFSKYAAEAKASGQAVVDLGNGHQITIPDVKFKQVADERLHEQRKRDREDVDVFTASVTNPANSAAVGASLNLAKADTGYLGSLTPGEVTDIITKKDVADTLMAQPGAMPQLAANKILTDVNKFIDETRDRYLKAAPEKERQALSQFHSTGGKIMDTTAASDFYTSRAAKTPVSPMLPNNIWAGADTAIRADLANRLKATAGINPSALADASRNGGMYLPNGKLPEDQLMQLNLNENGQKYKSDALNRMTAKILAESIGDIAKGDPNTNRPGISDFAKIYANGEITQPFKKNGALDESAVYNYLIKQDATTGSNNVAILKAMLNNAEYRKTWTQAEEQVNNMPEHAALRRLLFQGDTSQVFAHINMRIDHSVNTAADQALQAVQQLNDNKSFSRSIYNRTPGVN